MDEKEFWNIIETSKKEAKGDPYEQTEIIEHKLKKHSPENIINFEKLLIKLYSNLVESKDPKYSYRQDLNSAYYAISSSEMSDKKDLYAADNQYDAFILWIIGQGEEIYYKTLGDPDYLVNIVPIEQEGGYTDMELFSAVADNAYLTVTGSIIPRPTYHFDAESYDHTKYHNRPEFVLIGGEYIQIMKRFCPNLWAKFKPEY